MVNPNDARKLAWDWLVVCFVVYTTLATPLDLAFFDTECSQGGSTVRATMHRQRQSLVATLPVRRLTSGVRRHLLRRCFSR